MLKKWSLLRVSIIVLGNLVIFGLGFALGLNYAQNLYLVKKRIMPGKAISNEYSDSNILTADEFSFFYGLKNSSNGIKLKAYNNTTIREKKESIENQESNDNKDLKKQRNVLTTELPGYTIQLYSFKSKDVSEKKVKELKKKGYSAYQSRIDLGNNDIYYRVRVGQFKNREEAAKVLVKIFESETKEAYITRN
jgi:hypothetical protein